MYANIISFLYPQADFTPGSGNVELTETDGVTTLSRWALPGDPPTFEELEAVGQSPEYAAARLAAAKQETLYEIDRLDDWASIQSGIVSLSAAQKMRYTDNALRVQMWNELGRPDPPDEFLFATAYREGARFNPPKSAAALLAEWEAAWNAMSAEPGRELRRAAIELVKAAAKVEQVDEALGAYRAALSAALGSGQ